MRDPQLSDRTGDLRGLQHRRGELARRIPRRGVIPTKRSVKDGLGVMGMSMQLFLQRMGWAAFSIFRNRGRQLASVETPPTEAFEQRSAER